MATLTDDELILYRTRPRLGVVPDFGMSLEDLIEEKRSNAGLVYLELDGRILRGRDVRYPDEEWCHETRVWRLGTSGPIPTESWFRPLSEAEAERVMWPEFYQLADQWL